MTQPSERSNTGSITITLQESRTNQVHPREEAVSFWLTPRRKKKVSWKDDTVDNEFMQKKSSKICCIFHKEHDIDDSDSDEDEGKRKGKGKKDPCDNCEIPEEGTSGQHNCDPSDGKSSLSG